MPTNDARRRWLLALGGVVLLAAGLRLGLALTAHFPGPGDYAFYYTVARNLAAGRGLTIDYLWHYLSQPETITHSSLAFWAPLPSLLMAATLRLFGATPAAALLPGVLCGLLLPLPTYGLARQLGQSRPVAGVGAGLVLFMPVLFQASLLTESVIYYVLFVNGTLFCLGMGWRGRPAGFIGAALCAGLAHMTRLDGLLLALTVPFVMALAPLPGRVKLKTGALALLVYGLTVSPWLAANLRELGTPLPSAPARAAFFRAHDDLFAFNTVIDLDRYLAWGWRAIAVSKAQALLRNGLTLYRHMGPLLTLFFGLGVLLRLRQGGRAAVGPFTPVLVYGGALLFFHTIVGTFTGAGGFLRSSSALLPLILVVAVGALAQIVPERRHFGALIVGVGLLFAVESVLSTQTLLAGHNQLGRELAALDQVLDELAADGDGTLVLLAPFPWEVNAATDRPVIVIPSDGRTALLAAARRYEADYLLLPAVWPYLNDVYLGLETWPELRLARAVPGTTFKLYAILPAPAAPAPAGKRPPPAGRSPQNSSAH